MVLADRPTLPEARAALAAEWEARSPIQPEEVAAFYRDSHCLGADLDAWHAAPGRQSWTEMLTYIAGQIGARTVVDIGAGAGYELRALREADPERVLVGIEPNRQLAVQLAADGFVVEDSAESEYIASADLLVCFDVLEHVPEPETFLGAIARRARLGAVLVETVATFDTSTPLHLKANRGWHPGHCLEAAGWVQLESRDRVRVWQRLGVAAAPRASLLLCAYRACSIPTMQALLELSGAGWRIMPKWGDALISRVRSTIVSQWWAETADDVALMIDDDIVFNLAQAERIVNEARERQSIVCAAYPVRNGGHLAVRSKSGAGLTFGPDEPLVEIDYAATGFMAIPRGVIDALMPTLPLLHEDQPWCFRPLFLETIAPMGDALAFLSEDWAFSKRASDLGFTIWLDPTIKLGHLGTVEINVNNMAQIHAAVTGGQT